MKTSRCVVTLFVLALPMAAHAGAFWKKQRKAPRFAQAERHAAELAEQFRDAGSTWPPRGVYLRAFKLEGVVELWAAPKQRGDDWVHVRDFAVCQASGVLGPKRRSGDLQVPEGFYFIDRFNPWSSYHLSLGLNYPNVADRARTPTGASPGGDIFVHGDCVTIGCLPLRDAPMERLFMAAVAARDNGQRRVPVHVFPCRMDDPSCRDALATAGALEPELIAFWQNLRPAFALFERFRRPPKTRPLKDGRYRILGAERLLDSVAASHLTP